MVASRFEAVRLKSLLSILLVVIYLCGLMTKDQINVRTNKGKGATALWWALHMFHEDHPTVKALLKHGAKSIAPHTA